jgi:hypothetical protein
MPIRSALKSGIKQFIVQVKAEPGRFQAIKIEIFEVVSKLRDEGGERVM